MGKGKGDDDACACLGGLCACFCICGGFSLFVAGAVLIPVSFVEQANYDGTEDANKDFLQLPEP